jgi:hypothetical protein
MGLTARLADAAGLAVKRIGSLELVAWSDIDAFLNIVRDRKVAILGIEGFRVDGSRAVPDMDAIADFSGLPTDQELVATTLTEATRFLSSVSQPNMYFDFELADDACRA